MHKSPAIHAICVISLFLAAIGAINWGLKPFGYNLVESIGSYAPVLVDPIYYIVGIAGIITLIVAFYKTADGCKC